MPALKVQSMKEFLEKYAGHKLESTLSPEQSSETDKRINEIGDEIKIDYRMRSAKSAYDASQMYVFA